MVHDICLSCCKYSRKECPGQEKFSKLWPFMKPDCYRECPDECPFDGDCPAALNYPPEEEE